MFSLAYYNLEKLQHQKHAQTMDLYLHAQTIHIPFYVCQITLRG